MKKVSDKLKIYKYNNFYYGYHTLFGNLTKFNHKTLEVLNNFQDYQEQYPDIIGELEDNYFLVMDNEEEDIIKHENNDRNHADDGRNLIGLQLIVSNFCNFSCKYCFLDKEHKLRDNSQCNAPSNMTFNVAKKAIDNMIDSLKRNNNNILSIEFFGGEPLMNWSLVKQVFDTYGKGDCYGIEMYYTITTNGSLITEEIAKYFNEYEVNVIISYDSPNSRERITKDGKELTEILKPILYILKKYNVSVSFNSVISKWTINNYDSNGLVDFAVENGIHNLGLILDLDAEFLTERWTENDIIKLILDTYDYGKLRGLRVTGYWEMMYEQILNREATYFEKGYKACPATGCKVSVEPSGDVFACKCCTYKIGILDQWDELLHSNKYKKYLNKVYKNGEGCNLCELCTFCSGVCVGSLEKKGSMYGINSSLCYIYRTITKELILRTKDSEFVSLLMINE